MFLTYCIFAANDVFLRWSYTKVCREYCNKNKGFSKGMMKFRSIEVQNQLWTAIQSIVGSAYVSVLVFATARLMDLPSAGVLAFAAAISDIMRSLISLSVRLYQSTDIKQEFNFNTYLVARTACAIVVTVIFATVLALGQFDLDRVVVVLLFYFAYLTHAYADVFYGDLQQKGKMRVAGKMLSFSFGGAIIVYTVTAYLTRELIPSLAFSGLVVFFVNVIWIWFYRKHFGKLRQKVDKSDLKKLIKNILPLAVTTVLFAYLYNAQKYFLSAIVSDAAVAIFTILILPMTVFGMISGFFFHGAELTRIAEILESGQIRRFTQRVYRQFLLIAAIFVPYILGIYFLGIPILSWVYNVDLSEYRLYLTILSGVGGFYATTIFLGAVLVVLRRQKAYLCCMGAVAIVTAPLMWILISQYGITGAMISSSIVYVALAATLYVVYRIAKKQLNIAE